MGRTQIGEIVREGIGEIPELLRLAGAAATEVFVSRPDSVKPLSTEIAETAEAVTPEQ